MKDKLENLFENILDDEDNGDIHAHFESIENSLKHLFEVPDYKMNDEELGLRSVVADTIEVLEKLSHSEGLYSSQVYKITNFLDKIKTVIIDNFD